MQSLIVLHKLKPISLLIARKGVFNRFGSSNIIKTNNLKPISYKILNRFESTNVNDSKPKEKKQSMFKKLYSQYGPLFVVVHLTTVVIWIYSFFLISKQ